MRLPRMPSVSRRLGWAFTPTPHPHALKRIVLERTVALEHRSAERRHVACSFDKCTDDRLIRGDPFDSFLGVLV